VPVGEDQEPHVELTRTLARRFNLMFGETFPVPEMLARESIRVPGLDGTGKMGKSDNNTIDLSDSPEIVRQKLNRAVTDTNRQRRSDPGNPLVCNIFTFHMLLSNGDQIQYVQHGCKNASIGCIDCKKIVIDAVNEMLQPIQEKRKELDAFGSKYYLEILHEGGLRARERVAKKVAEAKQKMGVPFY
jgi:tryptophanyl-tRNA synthetase